MRSEFFERDQKKGSASRSCAGEDGVLLSANIIGKPKQIKYRRQVPQETDRHDRDDQAFQTGDLEAIRDHRA
jgi:hypothetical protein